MRVKLGDSVYTEFGSGTVKAMTEEWCVVETHPLAKLGEREVAVMWSDVWVPLIADQSGGPGGISDHAIQEK